MHDDFLERVERGFSGQGFMSFIGARLTRVEIGVCHIAVPFSEQLTQQHGFFHGGLTATLADNAAGFAGYTQMSADEQPLSVEFKINFVAPAEGQKLEARARVVRNGRRLKHVQVEVFASRDAEERLVAVALATIAATHGVKEPPPTRD